MADKQIGSAAVILGFNQKPLDQGLAQSQDKIVAWVVQINDKVSVAIKGVPGLILAAFTSAFGFAKGWFDDLTNYAYKFYDGINALSKQGATIGLNTTDMQTLSAITKKSADEIIPSIQRMQREINSFAHGGKLAGEVFDNLGLTIDDLSGTSLEQFRAVADAIKKIENPVEQSAAAFSVFGRQGENMLGAINGDMDKAIKKATELGFIFSQENNEAMAKISSAWKEVSKIGTGIWNSFAVAVSPIFQRVAEVMISGWESIAPSFRKLAEVGQYVASFIGVVMGDAFEFVKGLLDNIIEALGVNAPNALGGMKEGFQTFAMVVAQGIGVAMTMLQSVASFLVGTLAPGLINVAMLFTNLMRQSLPMAEAVLGWTHQQTEAMVNGITQTEIGLTRARGQLREAAGGIGESDIFSGANITNMMNDIFTRMEERAKQTKTSIGNMFDEEEEGAPPVNKLAGGLTFGSRESIEAIYKAQFPNEDKQLNELQKGNSLAERQIEILQRIEDNGGGEAGVF